jgi:hypothetical protein
VRRVLKNNKTDSNLLRAFVLTVGLSSGSSAALAQNADGENSYMAEYECHTWAVKETGYEPDFGGTPTTHAPYSDRQPLPEAKPAPNDRVKNAVVGGLLGSAVGAVAGNAGVGGVVGGLAGALFGGGSKKSNNSNESAAARVQAAQDRERGIKKANYDRAYAICMQAKTESLNAERAEKQREEEERRQAERAEKQRQEEERRQAERAEKQRQEEERRQAERAEKQRQEEERMKREEERLEIAKRAAQWASTYKEREKSLMEEVFNFATFNDTEGEIGDRFEIAGRAEFSGSAWVEEPKCVMTRYNAKDKSVKSKVNTREINETVFYVEIDMTTGANYIFFKDDGVLNLQGEVGITVDRINLMERLRKAWALAFDECLPKKSSLPKKSRF